MVVGGRRGAGCGGLGRRVVGKVCVRVWAGGGSVRGGVAEAWLAGATLRCACVVASMRWAGGGSAVGAARATPCNTVAAAAWGKREEGLGRCWGR